ncbi:FhaA domain-containing protein [Ornithinimicrobium faecis]|nr:FhaA domain-containing protein [Ornithinimicrobium sp. HY1793]
MGIIDRVERGLERAVKAPFAKVFKAEVQPVEIASAMRGAMDERAAVLGPGRTMVPNVFTVELANTDFERLSSYDTALTDELVAAAEDHADAQRYTPAGTVEVRLISDDELETGIFRVRPASKNARRQGQRPPQQGPRPGGGQRPDQSRMPQGQPRPQPGPSGGHSGEPAGGGPGQDPNAAFRPPQQGGPSSQQGMPPQQTGAPAQGAPPQQRPAGAPRQAPPGVGAAAAAAARGGQAGAGTPAYAPPGSRGPSTREFPTSTGRSQRPVSGRGPRPWLDMNGRAHSLTAAVTVLGRDASADLVVDDPGVSRRHVEVRITHDGPHQQVMVRDLGSTNGSYVNGDQVGTEQLTEGDRLTVGSTTLIFHAEGGR